MGAHIGPKPTPSEENAVLKKWYDAGFVFTSKDKVEFCATCKALRRQGVHNCDKHEAFPTDIRET